MKNLTRRICNNLKYVGWKKVLIIFSLLILWNVFPLLSNYINKFLTDAMIANNLALSTLIILIQILIWIVSTMLNAFDQNVRQESVTRSETYDKLLIRQKKCELSIQYFETPVGVETLSKANRSVGKYFSIFKNTVCVIILVPTLILSLIPVMKAASWAWLFLVGLFLINVYISSKCADVEYLETVRKLESERKRNYYKSLFYNFSALKEVKSYNIKNWLLNKYELVSKKIFKDVFHLHIRTSSVVVITDVLSMVVKIFFWVYVCFQAIEGKMSISNCVLFIGLWDTAIGAIEDMRDSLLRLYNDSKGIRDIELFLNTNENKPNTIEVKKIEKIEIKDLSFSYPTNDDQMVLNKINLILEKGNCYLILGENGAGKSTLVKLLLQHYRINEGAIIINENIDIDLVSNLRVGYMSQADPHFSLSIKDNILFGNEYDAKRFDYVISKAGISDLIKLLPEKEDTLLGIAYDNGRELSGGQWQRINFARLLYNQTEVVILDEPTANMDPIAERDLYYEIKEMFRDRIVIIVSHRLSSVGIADKIILLENGNLIGFDSHRILIETCDSYRELFNVQKRIVEGG